MTTAIDFEPFRTKNPMSTSSNQISCQFQTGNTEMLTEHELQNIQEHRTEIVYNLRAEKALLATLDSRPFPENLHRWSAGPMLEFFSSVLSAGCLVVLLFQWSKGSANVRLTQEVLLYTDEISLTLAFHTDLAEYLYLPYQTQQRREKSVEVMYRDIPPSG